MDNIFNFFKHNGQNDFFKNRQPKKGGSIKALIIVLIGFIIFEYFALVPLNFRSPEFLMVLAFFILIYTGLRSLLNASFDKATKIGIVVPVFIIAYVFIGQFLSSEIFHASSYQAQLTVDKEADFYADNETVNYQSIPVVDKDSAQRLGDRKMGEIVSYKA